MYASGAPRKANIKAKIRGEQVVVVKQVQNQYVDKRRNGPQNDRTAFYGRSDYSAEDPLTEMGVLQQLESQPDKCPYQGSL